MSVTLRRATAAAGLTLAGVLGLASAAGAAGVGAVSLVPAHGTAFHVSVGAGATAHQTATLRNLGKAPVTTHLYAAQAARSPQGAFSVGAAGSAAWIGLTDRTLSLAPGQSLTVGFTVRRTGAHYGAVVVEQASGTVIQRAATLVYVEPGRGIGLPRLAVGSAVGLLLTAGAGLLVVRRRDSTKARTDVRSGPSPTR